MLTQKKRKTLEKSLSCPRNRHGEPMVCSPTDALNMLYGSDLQFLGCGKRVNSQRTRALILYTAA
jgi:predicted NodU family carbamoyl transferase